MRSCLPGIDTVAVEITDGLYPLSVEHFQLCFIPICIIAGHGSPALEIWPGQMPAWPARAGRFASALRDGRSLLRLIPADNCCHDYCGKLPPC